VPDKPTTAAGHEPDFLEHARRTCSHMATVIGDTTDDIPLPGDLVPLLIVAQASLPPGVVIRHSRWNRKTDDAALQPLSSSFGSATAFHRSRGPLEAVRKEMRVSWGRSAVARGREQAPRLTSATQAPARKLA